MGDGCQTPHLNFSHWPPESLSTIKNSHVMCHCHCLCLSFPFLSALSSLTHSLVFHRRLPETEHRRAGRILRPCLLDGFVRSDQPPEPQMGQRQVGYDKGMTHGMTNVLHVCYTCVLRNLKLLKLLEAACRTRSMWISLCFIMFYHVLS